MSDTPLTDALIAQFSTGIYRTRHNEIPETRDEALIKHARRMERDRARMLDWCRRHYAAEEGPGETDRPQFVELRALLRDLAPK